MFDDGITKVDPLKVVKVEGRASSLAGVLTEGSRFGVYVIGSCIGHGGMARIYRAEHEGLRRHVALKVLIDGFARDPEGRERFLREARIAAAIKHPNVVNIFDVGVQDDIPYLVMELLEGEDLEAMVNRCGALSEATLVDIVVPIVAGLAAVHDAGVVHRDLKPGNIFLSKGRNDELEPKLLDFGISRAKESEQFKLTTARGLLMGTPLYMSPEAIQGSEITAISDQYSLGVVLYECCTGFNPFAADTLAETVRRVTTGDFAPPSQYNPALSRRLARIISRAMSLDPSQRYADLREMGRELLMLAGQRTRITWSLSFGELAGKRTGSLAVLSDGLTSAPNARATLPAPARKWTSIAAVAFGLLTFAAAGALIWSKDQSAASDTSQQALQPAATGVEAPTPTAASPAPGVPAASSSVPAPAPRQPAAAAAPAPAALAEPDSPREQEPAPIARSARPVAERDDDPPAEEARPRRPRPAPAPAPRARAVPRRAAPEPVVQRAEEEPPPEWLPAQPRQTPAEQPRAKTSVGTNNAPIFE